MATTRELLIVLPLDEAERVSARVAKGDFKSAGEMVQAGLRALEDREAEIESWLHGPVAAAYDAHRQDPGAARDLDEAFADLRERLDALDRGGR